MFRRCSLSDVSPESTAGTGTQRGSCGLTGGTSARRLAGASAGRTRSGTTGDGSGLSLPLGR
jgi:hypothetical protein